MPAESKWVFTHINGPDDDAQYEFGQSDLTLSLLTQAKEWFGKEYGAIKPFMSLLNDGDGQAYAIAIWAARKKKGEQPGDPRHFDFSVGDVFWDHRRPDVEAALRELEELGSDAPPTPGAEGTSETTPD